eukprot:8385572-Pyramimonas_sp.AAC.1
MLAGTAVEVPQVVADDGRHLGVHEVFVECRAKSPAVESIAGGGRQPPTLAIAMPRARPRRS